MPEEKSSAVFTYHCVCSTHILTSTQKLDRLPTRRPPVRDEAIIISSAQRTNVSEGILGADLPSTTSLLSSVVPDRKPVIIRREDGFEKRLLLRCARCNVVLGYYLDDSHYDDTSAASKPVYLLPGGLVTTEEMKQGGKPEEPGWAALAD